MGAAMLSGNVPCPLGMANWRPTSEKCTVSFWVWQLGAALVELLKILFTGVAMLREIMEAVMLPENVRCFI